MGDSAEPSADIQASGRRFIIRSLRLRALEGVGFLALMIIAAQILIEGDGGVLYAIVEFCLSALAALYAVETYFWWKTSNAELRKVGLQERGSTYTSDLDNLPNTNYLLAELRKEMPRARLNGVPFVLVHFSMESLRRVRAAHGEETGAKAIDGLIQMLTRTTRSSDFFAHLGEGRFCSMLNECTTDLAVHYFKRIPKVIEVEIGPARILELPITARLYEYDLEAVYATDVVGEVQQADPVPGWEGDPREAEVAAAPSRRAAGRDVVRPALRPSPHPVPDRFPLAKAAPQAPAAPPAAEAPAIAAANGALLRTRMAPQKASAPRQIVSTAARPASPIPLDRFLSRQRAQAPAMGLLPSSIIPGPWTSSPSSDATTIAEPDTRASAS